MPDNSYITKKLKIAFKRWSKQCKAAGWDGFSEPFMASALFMIKISQKRQQNPDKTFDELLKIVQKENDDYFNKQQEKQLMRAKSFAEAQKLSEKETLELINNTQEKLAIELKKYQEQKNSTLKLFDYTIDESEIPFENFEESRKIIDKLDKLGYFAILINELKVIYEDNKSIGNLASKYLKNGYDIVTSGTFFTTAPLGTIILNNGKTFITNEPKALKRGGIAILNSGIISYNLTNGYTENTIRPIFDEKPAVSDIQFPEISETDVTSEFIGGGALLIHNGIKISGKDILEIQCFNQPMPPEKPGDIPPKPITDGLKAAQMRNAQHIVIGKNNELDYPIVPKKSYLKKGEDIQREMFEIGFCETIKFDGGRGLWVESNIFNAGDQGKANKSGFAIRRKKL